MREKNETIAAIATGLTPSGIGIIRMSGPESFDIIGKIFTNKKGEAVSFEKPNRIRYGFIKASDSISSTKKILQNPEQNDSIENDANYVSRETFSNVCTNGSSRELSPTVASNVRTREILDEVLVMNMKAPHSYTGEDTIEIDCHGGPLMMRRILQAVLENGARLAEPGEFTKRAFLNGRIDLAQAEAVIDIINAKNDRAIRAGVSQLTGKLSLKVKEIRDRLLSKTAYIEAALDDPEHYDLTGFGEEFLPELEKTLASLGQLIASYRSGKIAKEGINTCILGKPNAGKSSLLNALLGEERAIVTEIPGTTRDVIRESITFENLTLNIMDTAGIRDTEDKVERIGVEKAFSFAKAADLILYVIDASERLDGNDEEIIRFLKENRCRTVYVLNKADLEKKTEEAELLRRITEEAETGSSGRRQTEESAKTNVSRETSDTKLRETCVSVSAKNGTGIDRILTEIRRMFEEGSISFNDEVLITSERHLELLKAARSSLENVRASIENGLPEDFYTIDLMDAYRFLGMILGEETEDDLADRIFSEFCMGK